MQKIYFFNKKNPATGEVTDVIVDADERTASSYCKKTRHFKYIGWSDGRFMAEFKKNAKHLGKDDRGIMVQPSEEIQDQIKEVIAKEVEFARNNPNNSPPADRSRMGLTAKDQGDQLLMNRVRSMRN